MKKLISAVAAFAMIVPTVASASTASQALSIKSAAVQPVRASAKSGKTKLAPAVIIGVLATVAIIGGAVVLADNSDGDSR